MQPCRAVLPHQVPPLDPQLNLQLSTLRQPSLPAAGNGERPMHHRVALVMLPGQAREIEAAFGSAASESARRVALSCLHKCGPE
jgi:hypothetical protein